MDIRKLISTAPDLAGGTWANRIDYAASLLFIHGYISQSQREKITRKLEKQFTDALRLGEIIERAQEYAATPSRDERLCECTEPSLNCDNRKD